MWEKESVTWMHNSQMLQATRCLHLRGSAHSLLLCSWDLAIRSQDYRVWITAVNHLWFLNIQREFRGEKQGDILSTTFKNWLCDKSQCQGNLAIGRKRQPRKSLWDRRRNNRQWEKEARSEVRTDKIELSLELTQLPRPCWNFSRRHMGCIF